MAERNAPAWARTALLTIAVCGAGLAILVHFVEDQWTSPVSRVLVLAVSAIVPLGIAALRSTGKSWDALSAVVVFVHPPAAACAVVSLSMSPGRDAGLWSAPWMMLAILCACMGLGRLLSPGALRSASAWCSAAALGYLPVGAGWLVLSRMGLAPLGFDPILVALTAVHFHFAAFATPILASRIIEALDRSRTRTAACAAGLALVIAQPIVAAGITASPPLALFGAALLAIAILALSFIVLARVQRRFGRRLARVLVCASALVPLLTMPLAVLWSYGDVTGAHALGLDRMIDLHGIVNAFGLALAGLFAWVLEDRGVSAPA